VSALLDELLAKIGPMAAEEKAALLQAALPTLNAQRWLPNPGPQTDAYFCLADLLLYGGQGGGGKSALLLGLAMTAHRRSLVMRRQYTEMSGLIDTAAASLQPGDSINRSIPPRIRLKDKRLIEFGAAKTAGDEQSWQGQPHDLLAFDEAVQFLESQVRFLMGWNRPVGGEDEDQRCRTVLASNPPIEAGGFWIVPMFRPWLDITHHNPAQAGELRWFITDPDGKDQEVDGPDDGREWNGKVYAPKSRTFIPAALADNPYLIRSGYQATLDALPEPMRSAIRDGNFMAARKDTPDQIIPTAWVLAAQQRWTPNPPHGIPMCAIGVDASGGGEDPMVMAPRHDAWFARPIVIQGKDIPVDRIGGYCAGMIVSYRRDDATIVLDMGGGYGGPTLERLTENEIKVTGHKGAEQSLARTKDRKLGFTNKRTEVLWRFREALDPDQESGSPVALPDDPELVADLTAPTFRITSRGIQAESKEEVVKRLGRSTDKGDAVVMSWSAGLKQINIPGGWQARPDERPGGRRAPLKVITGRRK